MAIGDSNDRHYWTSAPSVRKQALSEDDYMKIPAPRTNVDISDLINKHHEDQQEPPRPHMGASQLGHHCDRWIWLAFRWAVMPKFDGRVLRLFRRGHEEEHNVIKDLRAIGCDVRKISSAQFRVDFGRHVSGSLDGIIDSGVPGAKKSRHVLEIKTHGQKSFDALRKVGSVQKAKPEHHTQMQVYMRGAKVDRALYYAVCKNDDSVYTERVKLNREHADEAIARGHRLTMSERLPEPISTDPTWYKCKWCAAHDFCHGSGKIEPDAVNCRTCANVTPTEDDQWNCALHGDVIPLDFQRKGCEAHVIHPDLVPWERKASDDEWTAVYVVNMADVKNGSPAHGVFSSKELLSDPLLCAAHDPLVEEMREVFGGEIIKGDDDGR